MKNAVFKDVTPCSLVRVKAFQTNLCPSSNVIRVAVQRPENSAHIYHTTTHRHIFITTFIYVYIYIYINGYVCL
jgi:hypothetical protein